MANKNKDLKNLFSLVKLSINQNPSEENAEKLIGNLTNCIQKMGKDPALASNFQTYWLEIKPTLKAASDPSQFSLQDRLISLHIREIMFPEPAIA